ncbi:hypothetical protein NDU88_001054 [Pleurodeles waltl]|uniref:Uncharacterized protein n=1 Tax=Pleurodeles waltl TaxID=8319 RepID=A0AAV7LYD3_PLEWA|nr:hypothetical protein NDU88_001054 [Pleurodeles waltl]
MGIGVGDVYWGCGGWSHLPATGIEILVAGSISTRDFAEVLLPRNPLRNGDLEYCRQYWVACWVGDARLLPGGWLNTGVTGRTKPPRTISQLVLLLLGLTRKRLRGQPIRWVRDGLCGNLGGQKARLRS